MSDSEKNNPSENEIESPVDGPTPDWMRMATSSSSAPTLSEENTPDWLKSIRAGKSAAKSPPPQQPPAEEDPYAGMSDLERLLAEEGIDLGAVKEERPVGSEGMSVRDWMISTSEDEMIRKQVGAEPPAEESEPVLAEEDPYAGMSDLERLLAEEGIDLGVVKEERPVGSEGMSVRDWMISTSEDEMIRKQVGAEPLAEESEPILAGEDDMMVVAEDLPDWLRGGQEEEPEQPVVASSYAAVSVAEEDLPDWLRDVAGEEEPAAAEFGEDLPDWLRDVEEEEPAAVAAEGDKMVVEEDLPDWLHEVEEEEELVEPVVTAPATTDNIIIEEDLPDWLRDVEEEEPVVTAAITDNIVVEEDLPDWLRDVEEGDTEPAPVMAETRADEEEFMLEEDELPDWLKEVQAEADEEEAALVGFSSTVTGEETALDFSEEEEELPDWLKEVQEEEVEATLTPVEAAAERTVEADLPDWLREGQEPESFAAETVSGDDDIIVEEELPDWLSEAEVEVEADIFEASEPSPEEPVRVIEEELPDWLREVEEEAPVEALVPPTDFSEVQPVQAESAETVSIIEETDLPDWLRGVEEATEEVVVSVPETPAVDVVRAGEEASRELPDWLREVEEIETVPETVLVESEAQEEAVSPVQELPEWLLGVEEAGEAVEEAKPEPVFAPVKEVEVEKIEEEVIPEPEPEPQPISVIPISPVTTPPLVLAPTEMPDWLKKLRQGFEEPAPAPVYTPLPQPVPMTQPMAVAAPEAVVVSAAKTQPKLPADADKLLEMARAARTKGNIEESAPLYDNLVANGAHLDSVIEDMRQSVKTYPSNYLLYQIMGDAMMKDGRLQNALEAYRQALAALSK